MRVVVGVSSDIGRARERNEDSYLVREPLFAVADGMGGHRGGDVASTLVVKSLEGVELTADGPLAQLVDGIKRANRVVFDRSEAERNLRGMGTTLSAVLTEGDRAHVAHVGDSRVYLFRDGTLQQLTEDHTLVQRMVKDGRLTREQAERHPQRNILTRVLGVDEDLPVDELTLDLHEGDRLVLCTDGLFGMLHEDEIQQVLEREADAQAAADRLVEAANSAGGDDNITVIVLDLTPDGGGTGSGSSGRAAATVVTGPGAPLATRTERPPRSVDDTSALEPVRDAEASAPTEQVSEAPPPFPIRTHRPAPAGDGAPARVSEPRRPIRWWKVVAWVAVLAVVVTGGWFGANAYIDRQWYVGASGGRVAIYNGMPATVLGRDLSEVHEVTDIPIARASQLQPWREQLAGGITADSLEDARSIVAQIRSDIAEAEDAAA